MNRNTTNKQVRSALLSNYQNQDYFIEENYQIKASKFAGKGNVQSRQAIQMKLKKQQEEEEKQKYAQQYKKKQANQNDGSKSWQINQRYGLANEDKQNIEKGQYTFATKQVEIKEGKLIPPKNVESILAPEFVSMDKLVSKASQTIQQKKSINNQIGSFPFKEEIKEPKEEIKEEVKEEVKEIKEPKSAIQIVNDDDFIFDEPFVGASLESNAEAQAFLIQSYCTQYSKYLLSLPLYKQFIKMYEHYFIYFDQKRSPFSGDKIIISLDQLENYQEGVFPLDEFNWFTSKIFQNEEELKVNYEMRKNYFINLGNQSRQIIFQLFPQEAQEYYDFYISIVKGSYLLNQLIDMINILFGNISNIWLMTLPNYDFDRDIIYNLEAMYKNWNYLYQNYFDHYTALYLNYDNYKQMLESLSSWFENQIIEEETKEQEYELIETIYNGLQENLAQQKLRAIQEKEITKIGKTNLQNKELTFESVVEFISKPMTLNVKEYNNFIGQQHIKNLLQQRKNQEVMKKVQVQEQNYLNEQNFLNKKEELNLAGFKKITQQFILLAYFENNENQKSWASYLLLGRWLDSKYSNIMSGESINDDFATLANLLANKVITQFSRKELETIFSTLIKINENDVIIDKWIKNGLTHLNLEKEAFIDEMQGANEFVTFYTNDEQNYDVLLFNDSARPHFSEESFEQFFTRMEADFANQKRSYFSQQGENTLGRKIAKEIIPDTDIIQLASIQQIKPDDEKQQLLDIGFEEFLLAASLSAFNTNIISRLKQFDKFFGQNEQEIGEFKKSWMKKQMEFVKSRFRKRCYKKTADLKKQIKNGRNILSCQEELQAIEMELKDLKMKKYVEIEAKFDFLFKNPPEQLIGESIWRYSITSLLVILSSLMNYKATQQFNVGPELQIYRDIFLIKDNGLKTLLKRPEIRAVELLAHNRQDLKYLEESQQVRSLILQFVDLLLEGNMDKITKFESKLQQNNNQ